MRVGERESEKVSTDTQVLILIVVLQYDAESHEEIFSLLFFLPSVPNKLNYIKRAGLVPIIH